MDTTDWHVFLAVTRHGSTLAASRHLNISQSSVSRRIDALERHLALKLFDRSATGYDITPAGKIMVPKAEAIVFAINDARGAAAQHAHNLAGRIRFTTLEAFGQTFIVPAIGAFRQRYPDIQIDLLVSEGLADLSAGDADVALRSGPQPEDPALVIRRVMSDGWSVYCSSRYAAIHGIPKTPDDLADHTIIALPRAFHDAPLSRWFDETVPERAIVLRSSGVPGLLAGLKSGAGVSLMSDMVAATDATLMLCFVPPVEMVVPVWLVTTRRLQHEPPIRALLEFMADYLKNRRFTARV